MNHTTYPDPGFDLSLPEFPPHAPERYETIDDLGGDEAYTNGRQAAYAKTALEHLGPVDDEPAKLVDLAVAVFHRLHALGGDPADFVWRAINHFTMEAGPMPGTAAPGKDPQ
jgi:hypothetical protein